MVDNVQGDRSVKIEQMTVGKPKSRGRELQPWLFDTLNFLVGWNVLALPLLY